MLGTSALFTGDIELGSVEIKNSTTDTRVNVLAASTAAQATDTPMVVALHPSSPVPAGENHIGSIGGNTFTLQVTQTTNASAYEAGDCVGGKITITNAMRVATGTGVLMSIDLIDKANQKAAMDVLIFNADPAAATITDDTAFVYSTDITKQIARIPIAAGDYTTINSIATVSLGSLGRTLKAASGQNLYAALVLSGTPTYTSTSDIVITFGILQD